ncbi:MAG: SCO family protein [Gammaproteobacteria bacterium]
MTGSSPDRGGRHLIPLAIVGACVAPLAVAWLLTFSGIAWQPEATVNVGKLVMPPMLLKTSGLRLPNGQTLAADGLRGRWRIAAFAAKPCDTRCRDSLMTMRSVQLALGKNVLRVQRVLFLPKGSGSVDKNLLGEYPQPLVLTIEAGLAEFLAQFGMELFDLEAEKFYIIDPEGRLILAYPDASHFLGMVEDLRRLLQASTRA